MAAALKRAASDAERIPPAACPGVHFLIDECVSLILVNVAHQFGYPADHVSHRGFRKLKDHELRPHVLQHDYTLVTNNRDDWVAIVGNEDLHPGLVVILENAPRAIEIGHFAAVLSRIATERSFVNRIAEVDARGRVELYDLPVLS